MIKNERIIIVLNWLANNNPNLIKDQGYKSIFEELKIINKENPSILEEIVRQIELEEDPDLKHLSLSRSGFFDKDNVHPLLSPEPVSGSYGTKYTSSQTPDE